LVRNWGTPIAPRTHLFVAPSRVAFGEALLGLRLAWQLHARGERVMFLAPESLGVLFAGTPFRHGTIDPVLHTLPRALPDVIRTQRCDTVVLLDLALAYLTCFALRLDPAFLGELPVPAAALDIWDVVGGGRRWDMCEVEWRVPDAVLGWRRVVPVPFVRPSHPAGYNALPDVSAAGDGATRERVRADLGIAPGERMVVLTTAAFQGRGLTPFQKRALAALPDVLSAIAAALGPGARILHIGPAPIRGGAAYRHHPPAPPSEFLRLLGAGDLLLTLNRAATTVSTALALGLPAVTATSSGVAGEPWLARIAPAYPFRMFPFGLHHAMEETLRDNPYAGVVPEVELFQPERVAEVCRGVLFDADLRAAAIARAGAYVASVRALPTALERLDEVLPP
jgi:hypothetical protein